MFLLLIRTLGIFLILFLLTNPLLKKEVKHIVNPKVLYIQDNSESISFEADSSFIQSTKRFPIELKASIKKDFTFHAPNSKSNVFNYHKKKT